MSTKNSSSPPFRVSIDWAAFAVAAIAVAAIRFGLIGRVPW
jgi:hypothetical protein